jgi:glucokinase
MGDGAAASSRRKGTVTAGVDLGGTKIQVVILRSRRMIGSNRVPTPQAGAGAVTAAIVASVRAALVDAGSDPSSLRAVGVGTPGTIHPDGGVSNSPNVPGFEAATPIALGRTIASAFDGVPTVVDNDVRVGIVGEVHRGAGRPFRNALGVFCGTGVGGGLVLRGKLHEGRGSAGEIGHTLVKEGGRRCGCGKRGHLEAYAGRKSMEVEARRRVQRGAKTDLFKIMEKRDRDRVTSGVIARALEEGDAMTIELLADAVWALGIALSNAQNLLDVDAIIVGGGLADRLGPPFVGRIAEAMQPRLHVAERPPAVLSSELGDLSGAVGAAVRAGG